VKVLALNCGSSSVKFQLEAWVIPTDEEQVIARETARRVSGGPGP
jgi:acetate kinase